MASFRSNDCCKILQMVISAVGFVLGCSGFIIFKYHYNNVTTANLSLLAGCMAGLVLFLRMYVMYCKAYVNTEQPPSLFHLLLIKIIWPMTGITIVALGFGAIMTVIYFSIGYWREGFVIPSITKLSYSSYTNSALSFSIFLSSLMMTVLFITDNDLHSIIQLEMEEQQPLLMQYNRFGETSVCINT